MLASIYSLMALRHGCGIGAEACPNGLTYQKPNPQSSSNFLGLRLSRLKLHDHHIPPGASHVAFRRFPLALAIRRSQLGGGNIIGDGDEQKKANRNGGRNSSSAPTASDQRRVAAEEKSKGDGAKEGKTPTSSSSSSKQQQGPSVSLTLEDVNPVGLGRRSRQIFDEVWRKFSGLGQISRTPTADDRLLDAVLIRGPMCEFTIPGAQDTTVLVVGATSRIGQIVVRKLMLRGYKVKVSDSVGPPAPSPNPNTNLFLSCALVCGG